MSYSLFEGSYTKKPWNTLESSLLWTFKSKERKITGNIVLSEIIQTELYHMSDGYSSYSSNLVVSPLSYFSYDLVMCMSS